MSKAEQWLRLGDLQEALKDLQAHIRREPANSGLRVFLFQLLAVRGDWTRALAQLDVAVELDKKAGPLAQVYREAIRCETARAEVFAGRQNPLVLGEPPAWLAILFEALRLDAQTHYAHAAELRGLAFEQAEAVSGEIDGQPFQWIADADSRLGPVAEVIINGQYYWVPFQRIQQIHFEPPVDLRDLIWAQARFILDNGGEAFGLIPVRYPGSETAPDSALALSRKTEWRELSETVFAGLGQRILATDAAEYALLELRHIRIGAASA
jgi:type VI secretion system protein ImpE